MPALIETENLGKTYAGDGVETPALRGISIKVERGEFVAVMGPSGSGKSTLLHLLGLLATPSNGIYRFDGKDATLLSEMELAQTRNERLGFVFQAFNLLPKTTVYDNVLLPLLYSTVPERDWKERAERAIESVGLAHRTSHESGKLSGGEKQRVAIARALINNPSVIFADEPTGNLDSKSGGQVMEVFSRLNREGRTIILITHETYTAEHASRIIRLKDGVLEREEKVEKRRNADGFIK